MHQSIQIVDKYKDDEAFKQVYDGFLFYISVNFQNSDLANLNVRKTILTSNQ